MSKEHAWKDALRQKMPFNHLQRITAPSQNKAIGDATKAVQGYERFVDNQASTRDQ